MTDQQFCLRWNNHQSTLISVFDTLLENGTLVDCTLAAEGQYLKAHKVVLSACSPYLETLLSQHYEKHPIVILKDVKFTELKSMMDYMYRGEVNISQDQLGTFLKAAESLQIKGLSENGEGDARDVGSTQGAKPQAARKTPANAATQQQRPEAAESPANRDGSISPTSRKRRRIRRSSDDDNHLDANSCDLPSQAQSTPIVPNIPASITSTPIKPPIVKPEVNDRIMDHNSLPPESGLLKEKIEPAEPLLEPKTEYLEDLNNDDSVEDLTLDDDDEMDMSQMSNMSNISRPGPSHGADLSNQGFAPWQLGNQSGTDEVFMAAQEAVNAQRDSQDIQEPFECTTCHYIFDNQKALSAHLRQVSGESKEDFCFLCDHQCSGSEDLDEHLHSVHPDQDTSIIYVCQDCEEQFRTYADLECHWKTCSKNKAPGVSVEVAETKPKRKPKKKPQEERIVGSVQGFQTYRIGTRKVETHPELVKMKTFFSSKDLDEVKKGYKCEDCGNTSASYYTAKVHYLDRCSKKDNFKYCHLCPYKSRQLTNVKRHVKIVHERPDIFICEKCGKMFTERARFSHHTRHICEPTMHLCHICSFQTKIPGLLTRHLLKKHDIEVEPPPGKNKLVIPDPIKVEGGFECPECTQVFELLINYDRHRKRSCGRGLTLKCVVEGCGTMITNVHNMRRHLKVKHNMDSSVKGDKLILLEAKNTEPFEEDEIFGC